MTTKKCAADKVFVPETAVWEITLNCNMRCIHCGSTAIPGQKRPAELTTDEAVDLIGQLAELGTRRVVLSGGEPFIRKDWNVLAAEVARCGMVPSFISNGFMVDKAVASAIGKLGGAAHIGISIDGTEKVHDHIRQRQGSFKRSLNALQTLQDNGVLCSVITQVNKLNFATLAELRDVIFSYNIYAWQIQLATPWGRLTKDLILSPEEYLSLLDFVVRQKEVLGDKISPADDLGYFSPHECQLRPGGSWEGCPAGLRVVGLTSNGGVMGCLSLQDPRFLEGNIRERKLKDIWNDPKAFSYNRRFDPKKLKGYCGKCHYRLQCRAGCHNTAYSITGSLYENSRCAFRTMMENAACIGKKPVKNRRVR